MQGAAHSGGPPRVVKNRGRSANRAVGWDVFPGIRCNEHFTVFSSDDYINNIVTVLKKTHSSLLGTVRSSVGG